MGLMKKYGLGIIGFGGMGYYHYQKIAKDDRMFIAGIYDINDERMKFAAEQDINTYESAEALLADEKVNIVLVATPNYFHKEYSIAALRAKKAVICEKPVTLNSKEEIPGYLCQHCREPGHSLSRAERAHASNCCFASVFFSTCQVL